MLENNPVQSRMDVFLSKWTEAVNTPGVKLARIHASRDDSDMLEAFFAYILAVDTDQEDFVLVFNTPFSDPGRFASELLGELDEEIERWNTAEIPKSIPFEHIGWKGDHALAGTKNEARLFIENINSLANHMYPDKSVKVSVVLRMHYATRQQAHRWLSQALDLPFEPHVALVVSDFKDHALFDKLESHYPGEVLTLFPDFDMDGAMEEIANMGDPNKEETPYRQHLIHLMNAVKKRNTALVEKEAKACLTIASKAVKTNPSWLMQFVTVYTILYNNEIGNKDYNDAVYFADKAVESALLSEHVLEPGMAYRLIGQTHVGRGSIRAAQRKWEKANADYVRAEKAYATCADYIMQCESLRLCGWSSEKIGGGATARDYYIKAYMLIDKLTPDIVKGSTFPFVIKKIMYSNQREKVISDEQMDEQLIPIFGDDWRGVVSQYGKKPPKTVIPVN